MCAIRKQPTISSIGSAAPDASASVDECGSRSFTGRDSRSSTTSERLSSGARDVRLGRGPASAGAQSAQPRSCIRGKQQSRSRYRVPCDSTFPSSCRRRTSALLLSPASDARTSLCGVSLSAKRSTRSEWRLALACASKRQRGSLRSGSLPRCPDSSNAQASGYSERGHVDCCLRRRAGELSVCSTNRARCGRAHVAAGPRVKRASSRRWRSA